MTHYDLPDWLDYARGLTPAAARAPMAAHVRDGCARCSGLLGDLQRLHTALVADETHEPPHAVVRLARAVFAQFQPERVCRLPRLLAQLLQDSTTEPLPAGVRGNARSSRRVLYEAGDIMVDLRIEQRPGRSEVTLVGQLLAPGEPGVPVPRRPVVLTSGRRVLVATSTNSHGEFLVDYAPAGRVRLHIPIDECTKRIEISLNPLLSQAWPRRPSATVRQHGAGRIAPGSTPTVA